MGWKKTFASLKKDWHNAPNLITLVRLLFSFIVPVILLSHPVKDSAWWWACGIFAVLAATDKVDGWVARKYDLVSNWGKIFDPFADKALVLLTLGSLCYVLANPWLLGAVAIIAIMEITVIVILAFAKGRIDQARQAGRVKMVAQGVTITVLLMPLSSAEYIGISIVLVLITIGAGMYSCFDYARAAKKSALIA